MSNYAVHNPNTGEIQEQFDSLAPERISGVIERAGLPEGVYTNIYLDTSNPRSGAATQPEQNDSLAESTRE